MNHRRAVVRTRQDGRAPGGTRPPAKERAFCRRHQQKSTSARGCVVSLNRRHARGCGEECRARVSDETRRRGCPAREPSSGASDSGPLPGPLRRQKEGARGRGCRTYHSVKGHRFIFLTWKTGKWVILSPRTGNYTGIERKEIFADIVPFFWQRALTESTAAL